VQHQELPQHDRRAQVRRELRALLRALGVAKKKSCFGPDPTHTRCRFEYLWKDEGRYKQATALPAPQYISLLFQTTEQIFTHSM